MTLQQAAMEIAAQSYHEVTTEPEAYGVERPWRSIQEWVDFELDGDGPQELMRRFGIDFKSAARELAGAMWSYADLDELNAKVAK